MNSKQRRQDLRKWRYNVSLDYDRVDQNGYDNMFDWCRDTFGNGVRNDIWREKHQEIGTCWQFTNSKAAMLFAMRWK